VARRHFGQTHCLHPQGRRYTTQAMSKKQALSLLLPK
jgi:hypothetical protein